VTLNFLYRDIIIVMDPGIFRDLSSGHMGTLQVTQGFLLVSAILVEIPIAMTIPSRVLKYRARRWANIVAGTITTVVQFVTLFVGAPAPYYLFFSIIEIACTSLIVWYAWKWFD
jgi:hypothetical protein